MKKQLNGGMETIIAAVIIVGIVAALIISTVIPMSDQGEATIDAATQGLVSQQVNIRPN